MFERPQDYDSSVLQYARDNNLPLSIPDGLLMEIANACGKTIQWKPKYVGKSFIKEALTSAYYGLRVFQTESPDPSTYIDTFGYYTDTVSGKPLIRMQRKEYDSRSEIRLPVFEQRRIFEPEGNLLIETIGEVVDTLYGEQINPMIVARLTKAFPQSNSYGTAYATMYYSTQFHFVRGQNSKITSLLQPSSGLLVTQSNRLINNFTALPANINELTNTGLQYLRAYIANPYKISLSPDAEECLDSAYCADVLNLVKRKFQKPLTGRRYERNWKPQKNSINFYHDKFGMMNLPSSIQITPEQYGITLPVTYSLS